MYVPAGRPAFAWPYARGPLEYVTYELVLASPGVSCVSGTSNLDSFRDGGRWPYNWCLVGCCRQDLFNIARKLSEFLRRRRTQSVMVIGVDSISF